MITTYKHKKLTWINLEAPTVEDVESLMKKYSIPPLVAQELLHPTMRPRVEAHPNVLYLILHFPIFDPKKQGSEGREVDFIIGKNFLITTHYTTIDPLHEFSKMFEVNSILDKSNIGDHAGFLTFYILRKLYDFSLRELDHINEKIEIIEENVFNNNEKDMVEIISTVNRDLLNFRQAIKPHKEILASLERTGTKFFGDEFSYYLTNVTGEYFKVANQMDLHKETLMDLRETNDSLLSTKTNEIMKILTIMAFVTFPLSLIAGIFGMNTKTLPIVGMPGDFWIVIGAMVGITVLMFVYFKKKKWM